MEFVKSKPINRIKGCFKEEWEISFISEWNKYLLLKQAEMKKYFFCFLFLSCTVYVQG